MAVTMRNIPVNTPWINQIFDSQIARRGGIVRRKVTSVQRYASLAQLKAAVIARGYHMIQHGDQYLIFCDTGLTRMIC